MASNYDIVRVAPSSKVVVIDKSLAFALGNVFVTNEVVGDHVSVAEVNQTIVKEQGSEVNSSVLVSVVVLDDMMVAILSTSKAELLYDLLEVNKEEVGLQVNSVKVFVGVLEVEVLVCTFSYV